MVCYLALDPAVVRTGLALYTEGEDSISTVQLRYPKLPKKDFRNVYKYARVQVEAVGHIVESLLAQGVDLRVVTEYFPPRGLWAPGLAVVGTLYLHLFLGHGIRPVLCHSGRIDHLMGRRTKKPQRREKLFELLKRNKLSIIGKDHRRRKKIRPQKVLSLLELSLDEADASILLLYFLYNETKRIRLCKGLTPERWKMKDERAL